MCAIKFCYGIPQNTQNERHKARTVCLCICCSECIIVFLLPRTNQFLNRQPKKYFLPLPQQECCHMRPIRPLPSANGWINSNS